MLGVIEHAHLDSDGAQSGYECRQRPVALAADLGFHPVDFDNGLDDVDSAVDFRADDLLPNALQWPHWDQILVGEGIPHLLGRHLATITTGTFGDLLDNSAELDLQTAGQD